MVLQLRKEPPSSYTAQHAPIITVQRILDLVAGGLDHPAELWQVSRPYCLCDEKERLVNEVGTERGELLCEHERAYLETTKHEMVLREPLRELAPTHEDDGASVCFRLHGKIMHYVDGVGWYYEDYPIPLRVETDESKARYAEIARAVMKQQERVTIELWTVECGSDSMVTMRDVNGNIYQVAYDTYYDAEGEGNGPYLVSLRVDEVPT